MAINRLGDRDKKLVPVSNDDGDMKPLVREYGKEYPNIYEEAHNVISGRVSKSGVWAMIETENYTLLIKTSASAIQELYNNILPELNGKKANRLVIEPVKKDRYGGCLGVDDEVQAWYSFDDKTLEFTISETPPEKTGKKQQSLSLGMFLDTKELPSSEEKEEAPSNSRTRKTKDS